MTDWSMHTAAATPLKIDIESDGDSDCDNEEDSAAEHGGNGSGSDNSSSSGTDSNSSVDSTSVFIPTQRQQEQQHQPSYRRRPASRRSKNGNRRKRGKPSRMRYLARVIAAQEASHGHGLRPPPPPPPSAQALFPLQLFLCDTQSRNECGKQPPGPPQQQRQPLLQPLLQPLTTRDEMNKWSTVIALDDQAKILFKDYSAKLASRHFSDAVALSQLCAQHLLAISECLHANGFPNNRAFIRCALPFYSSQYEAVHHAAKTVYQYLPVRVQDDFKMPPVVFETLEALLASRPLRADDVRAVLDDTRLVRFVHDMDGHFKDAAKIPRAVIRTLVDECSLQAIPCPPGETACIADAFERRLALAQFEMARHVYFWTLYASPLTKTLQSSLRRVLSQRRSLWLPCGNECKYDDDETGVAQLQYQASDEKGLETLVCQGLDGFLQGYKGRCLQLSTLDRQLVLEMVRAGAAGTDEDEVEVKLAVFPVALQDYGPPIALGYGQFTTATATPTASQSLKDIEQQLRSSSALDADSAAQMCSLMRRVMTATTKDALMRALIAVTKLRWVVASVDIAESCAFYWHDGVYGSECASV